MWLFSDILLLCRSVHSVCLWDEKGAPKVQAALQQDIVDFIRDAQAVCMYFFVTKVNCSHCHVHLMSTSFLYRLLRHEAATTLTCATYSTRT